MKKLNMPTYRCLELRDWLATSATRPAYELPPVDLWEHMVACSHCRGMLALVVAATYGSAQPAMSCSHCAEELPALLDNPADQRLAPLWWHLWQCDDCAELYVGMGALRAAEQSGLLDPLPGGRRSTRSMPHLRLERGFLTALFAPQMQLGTAWDGDSEPMLLSEEHNNGQRIVLYIQQQDAQFWHFKVETEPPVVGQAVLTIGELERRSLLDDTGATAASGPDLVLHIEEAIDA
jgi:hypothetical protein